MEPQQTAVQHRAPRHHGKDCWWLTETFSPEGLKPNVCFSFMFFYFQFQTEAIGKVNPLQMYPAGPGSNRPIVKFCPDSFAMADTSSPLSNCDRFPPVLDLVYLIWGLIG